MKSLTKATSIFLHIFIGINAVTAGILFIVDPSGQKMGMTLEYIQHSPFSSYLMPGLVLFFINGISNFLAAFTAVRKYNCASLYTIVQGLILCGWILAQMLMVTSINWLHFSMFFLGFILTFCGWWQWKTTRKIKNIDLIQ